MKRRWKADEAGAYAIVHMDGTDECPIDRIWVSSLRRIRRETIKYARGIWPYHSHLTWGQFKRTHRLRIAFVVVNEL